MRRSTSTVLALGLAASAFAGVAAGSSDFVDCTPEDGVSYATEGAPVEETHSGAPFTYPAGEFASADAEEPTGGAFAEYHRIDIPVAFNWVDGQRATATVNIEWDTFSDLDLDVFNQDGENVGGDHAFNVDTQTYSATVVFSPDACDTYTVVVNNSYATPAQNISLTASVESKAPRKRG